MRGERTRAADGGRSTPSRGLAIAIALVAVGASAVAAPGARASSRTFEIDRMHAPKRAASVYRDKTASGKKAIVLDRRATVTLPPRRFGATRVGVWARTRECRGPARVKVYVDGRRVLSAPVQSGPWKEYGSLVNLPVRRHRVKITFPNPKRSSHCVRLLRLDRLVFSRSASEASPHDWHLAFDDEFDGTQVDQTKWTPANWQPVSRFYDPANVIVQDGMLRLRASAPNRSGMIQTLGKFQTTYGRIEASIRMPRGQGFWPAFWLRTPDTAQDDPEIDILEMWETDRTDDLNDQYTISHNYHWTTSDGTKESSHSWVRGSTDYTAGFHRFAVEWEPGAIRWYIDGVETKSYTSRTVADTPMFLVFSLQIGHAPWLGPEFNAGPTTPFPSYMDIEYLRVYQR